LAIGADGLIIEVHPCPERAWSDGAQSLNLDEFARLMRNLSAPIRAVASSIGVEAVTKAERLNGHSVYSV